MLSSSFAVLIALIIGVAFHCSANLQDQYCKEYYNPMQMHIFQTATHVQKHAVELYTTASTVSAKFSESAYISAWEAYASASRTMQSFYSSVLQTLDVNMNDTAKDVNSEKFAKDVR